MPQLPGRKKSEPKSAGRQATEAKAAQNAAAFRAARRKEKERARSAGETAPWVVPTFITLGLLGVLWLVVYYIASPYLPWMAELGVWNMAIGMGFIVAAFAVATQWH